MTTEHTQGRHIIVGVDGSTSSHAAVLWAAERAHETGARLTLLSAMRATPDQGVMSEGLVRALDERLVRELAAVEQRYPRLDVRAVKDTTNSGAGALVALSEDADLVVVGTRGTGGLSRLLLGSVSASVAAHAKCPVAVIGPDAAEADGPVVVGLDGSPESAEAADLAFAYAAASRRPVLAVHAPSVPITTPVAVLGSRMAAPGHLWGAAASDDHLAGGEALVQESLQAAREAYPDVEVQVLVQAGDPASVLADTCEERAAAAVVVGSRGRGGFTGLLLGSVGRDLTQVATCPVIVARGLRSG